MFILPLEQMYIPLGGLLEDCYRATWARPENPNSEGVARVFLFPVRCGQDLDSVFPRFMLRGSSSYEQFNIGRPDR